MNPTKNFVWARALAVAGLFCTSQSAQADVWSDTTTIRALYPTSIGYIFMTEYANTAYSTCDHGRRWEIPKTYDNYDAMIASLLLAFAQEKQIQFVIDERSPSCSGRVNRFYVYQ